MHDDGIDVLMITYNRPDYTRLALGELLDRSDESTRVWVWHNGTDEETLAVVRENREHPRFHRFHHSEENVALRDPTNWFWSEARGAYLSKVDDDCVVPRDWTRLLRRAHEDEPRFGVIGCWRFQDEDFDPSLAERKIREFSGGHRLLVNLWVEGSGYLMKRACRDAVGPIGPKQSFTAWCIEVARRGWINGWVYPFLYQEHMDDPRAEHTGLRSEADLEQYLPLSARVNGVTSIAEWDAQLRRSARLVQEASTDLAYWSPLRVRLRGVRRRLRKAFTRNKRSW